MGNVLEQGPCNCPGSKEKIVAVPVDPYDNSGSGDTGGIGGNGELSSSPPKMEQDSVAPQMANPYSTSVNSRSVVPAPDDMASSLGEDGARTASEWVSDQDQFAHLPALPTGWIRVKSRSSGGIYFCYTATGETTFTEPTGSPGQASQDLPPGWEEILSRSTGQVYYWNAALQRSQFEKPTAADASPPQRLTTEESEELPAGWVAMVSRSTGETYYFNTETQESQFARP